MRWKIGKTMGNNEVNKFKICYECKLEQPLEVEKCLQCNNQAFAHNNQIFAKKTYKQYELELISFLASMVPEFKDCKMCAEPIRFKALKCRYCGEFQN